jgi:microsomal dipeptidase-like Zn-dependent dipeptidase
MDTLVDHIDHALQVIGAPQVGFGSDGALVSLDMARELEGMSSVQRNNAGGPSFEWPIRHVRIPALNAANRLTALAEALARRRYSTDAIAGVVGGSFLRIIESVTGS